MIEEHGSEMPARRRASSLPEVSPELLEPRDLTSRVRRSSDSAAETDHGRGQPTGSFRAPRGSFRASAGSFALRRGSDPTSTPGTDRKECLATHGIARAILVAEETCRLYPKGHGRVRHALKDVLRRVQEHAADTGRPFAFVPEAVIDATEHDRSRNAKDLTALAYLCRVQLIQSVAIEESVDLDEIEELLELLRSRPDSRQGEDARPAAIARAASWRSIRVAFYEGEDEVDGYAFTEGGDQLFPASGGTGGGAVADGTVPYDVPRPLGKALALAFADERVQAGLAGLRRRLGIEDAPSATEDGNGAAAGGIDLIDEIVSSLFADPGQVAETPPEVVRERLVEFLELLQGIVSRLPDSGVDDATPTSAEAVRELLRRATGLAEWNRPSLPQLLRHSQRLRSLFNTPAALESVRSDSKPSDESGPPTPEEDPSASPKAARPARVEPSIPAPDRRPLPTESIPPSSGGFDEIASTSIDEAALEAELEARDWTLEAARVRLELLADETDTARYRHGREQVVERLASSTWNRAEEFLEELGAAADVLSDQALDTTSGFIAEVLARQDSQELVNRFFESRVSQGVEIVDLRPVLRGMASHDGLRPLQALTHLWKTRSPDEKDGLLDEIWSLPLDTPDVAMWGTLHPRAFSSGRSLAHLRSLDESRLRELLERIVSRKQRGKLGAPPAAVAVLRAVHGGEAGERLLAAALRFDDPQLRHEALAIIENPTTDELVGELERVLDEENAEQDPDLEAVRLVLTALLRSRRARAREILRRVRMERQRLLHVYRKEIREILELLRRVESVEA